ncbi:MAG: hypoxanthine phosphoribosyltransferase [Bacteroidetes bacterium]|nr:hypoxanthine phosphoribosyltransferase [Bacteroidota bacterium]
MKTYKIDEYEFNEIIDAATINSRVLEMADQINKDYAGKKPLFLITLTGGMFFGVELLKHINLDCKCFVISAKSYGKNMVSSGNVDINIYDINVKDEDIIIVEDIVDTGLTVTKLIKNISAQNPASIRIATFINKPDCNNYKVNLDYVGFNLDDSFLVGYGLDYKEYGRNLNGIYSL